MRLSVPLLLLILSCLCLAMAQVSYDDCCLKYVKKMNHRIQKHAVDYREQKIDGGCNIKAVVFIMRRGRKFCTDPREEWVEKLKRKINKMKANKRSPSHLVNWE